MVSFFALTVASAFLPETIVVASALKFHLSVSVFVAFIEISLVRVPSFFHDFAMTMIDVIFPLASVLVTILVNHVALPLIELSFTKQANFDASIWKGVAAQTIWLSPNIHLAGVNNFMSCLCWLMFAFYLRRVKHVLFYLLLVQESLFSVNSHVLGCKADFLGYLSSLLHAFELIRHVWVAFCKKSLNMAPECSNNSVVPLNSDYRFHTSVGLPSPITTKEALNYQGCSCLKITNSILS